MSRIKTLSLLFAGLSLIALIIVGCSDLISESSTSACNTAIDERQYATALTECTTRKDIASAYLGLAGFDIINLLKSTDSTTPTYTDPGENSTTSFQLGTDGSTGAQVLGILQIDATVVTDDTERVTKAIAAKANLDAAIGQLHPFLNDNSTPLDSDEQLLDAFALAFAMQIQQLINYDNATTSTTASGEQTADLYLSCPTVDNTSTTPDVLHPLDGHLWTAEQNGIQCNRLAAVVNAETDSLARVSLIASIAAVYASDTATLLDVSEAVKTAVCAPTEALSTYVDKLSDVTTKMSESGSSTDNSSSTSVLGDSSSATDTLLKALKCK